MCSWQRLFNQGSGFALFFYLYSGVAQLGARVVWEHRRCSHRTKAKTAESLSTVRISGGTENKKQRSKMCLTTDLTTYMTTI